MTNSVSQNRLVFLDNLRYFMVLLVVILHVSISYANVPWWYVIDANKHSFFGSLINLLDSFLMPVLFFISGYFALTSQRRRTMGAFMIAKLKRLGNPLFFGLFLLVPVMPYMYHYTRAITPLSFWEFWQGFVKSAGDFNLTLDDPNRFLMI
jgi:fucose 4-O-acetylase-like acetyltransferase